jgi:hypothetical protein
LRLSNDPVSVQASNTRLLSAGNAAKGRDVIDERAHQASTCSSTTSVTSAQREYRKYFNRDAKKWTISSLHEAGPDVARAPCDAMRAS